MDPLKIIISILLIISLIMSKIERTPTIKKHLKKMVKTTGIFAIVPILSQTYFLTLSKKEKKEKKEDSEQSF